MKNGPEVFKGNRRKKGARIILQNKLYWKAGVIHGMMRLLLTDKHWDKNNVELVVYWKNDAAVACVYKMKNALMAFCLPSQRRKGYGTACVDALNLTGSVEAYDTAYRNFWKNQKVKFKLKTD